MSSKLASLNLFNVIVYGADPTGVSDSTSAINAAVAAAFAAGGGTVYFPAGTFKISDNVSTLIAVSFIGNGQISVNVLGEGPNATFINLVPSNLNSIGLYFYECLNSKVSGLEVSTGTAGNGIGIQIGATSGGGGSDTSYDMIFENIVVNNLNYGIYTAGGGGSQACSEFLWERVIAQNCNIGVLLGQNANTLNHTFIRLETAANGIGLQASAGNVYIENCSSAGNTIYDFYFASPGPFTVRNGRFECGSIATACVEIASGGSIATVTLENCIWQALSSPSIKVVSASWYFAVTITNCFVPGVVSLNNNGGSSFSATGSYFYNSAYPPLLQTSGQNGLQGIKYSFLGCWYYNPSSVVPTTDIPDCIGVFTSAVIGSNVQALSTDSTGSAYLSNNTVSVIPSQVAGSGLPGNVGLGTNTQFAGGQGILALANAPAIPYGNLTASLNLYCNNGQLFYLGPTGIPISLSGGLGGGNSLEFNDGTAYVLLSYNPIVTGTTFTFALRFKTTTTGKTQYFFWNPGNSFAIAFDDGSGKIAFYNTTWHEFGSNSGYADGNWHDLLITFSSGTTATCYVDGIQLGSTFSYSFTGLAGGGLANNTTTPGSGYNFVGNLCDFRVWSRVLTSGEIAAYHVNTAISTTNLAIWLQLNEGRQAIALDVSGSGFNGTIVGNTTWTTSVPTALQTASAWNLNGTFTINQNNGTAQTLAAWSSTATTALQKFQLSRSNTVGGQIVVHAGDALGSTYYQGSDGTALQYSSAIIGLVDSAGTVSSGIVPGAISFLTANPSGVLTQALYLDRNQNATIGNSLFVNNQVGATSVAVAAAVTTVNGSTSGTAKFSQPMQGGTYKRVMILLTALLGTASYTFPVAFINTPVVVSTSGLATTIVTSLSTTAATVTGTTSSGMLIIEGY